MDSSIRATSLEQQLGSCLKQYNPLVLKLFDDLGSGLCLHFILRWPTLKKLHRASEGVLRKFFYKHNCRSDAKIQERLELIGNARALIEDAAIIEASSRKAQTLAGQLLTLCPQIKAYETAYQGAIQKPSRCSRVQWHSRSRRGHESPVAVRVRDRSFALRNGPEHDPVEWIRSGHGSTAGRTKEPDNRNEWSTGGGRLLPSCGKVSLNLPNIRSETVPGQRPFTRSKKNRANPAKPFFVPSLSSGPAFCFAVGKIANATMSKSISNRSNAPVHRCGKDFSKQMPTPCKHNMRKNSKNPLTDYLSFLSVLTRTFQTIRRRRYLKCPG